MSGNAYVTLLYSASYVPGALVLAHTLKKLNCVAGKFVLMIPNKDTDLSVYQTHLLAQAYDEIITVDAMQITQDLDVHNLESVLKRPELLKTFTKLQMFKLSFNKIVYMDCDILPVKNLDGLFDEVESENVISASPDAGWPDIFNTGLLAFKPNAKIYNEMISAISEAESATFDGADQGFFNEFFQSFGNFNKGKSRSWNRLSFLFNVTPTGQYQYNPAFIRFAREIKVLHFIGSFKPWMTKVSYYDIKESDEFDGSPYTLQKLWWKSFYSYFGKDSDIESATTTNEISSFAHVELEKFDPVTNFSTSFSELKVKSEEPVPATLPKKELLKPKPQTIVDYMFHDDVPERHFGPDPF